MDMVFTPGKEGSTYGGYPLAMVAGNAALDVIINEKLAENSARVGAYLRKKIEAIAARSPHVKEVRGRGLFIGVEFVEDKSSKKPFSPDFALHTHLKKAAMDAGLMIYPGAGTIDGQRGHHVLIAPSFIFEDQHIDEFIEKFDIALCTALNKA